LESNASFFTSHIEKRKLKQRGRIWPKLQGMGFQVRRRKRRRQREEDDTQREEDDGNDKGF